MNKEVKTFLLNNELDINEIKDLYIFITQELSFDKVMFLYKLLKNKIEGEDNDNM